ncbi:hypothetical protein BDZ91DRAFT_765152 [Kalaharituber pfeilii]|nr:hypothetical protein BDZ91DRAFT_765152 [Kalaharituber pfeilii]
MLQRLRPRALRTSPAVWPSQLSAAQERKPRSPGRSTLGSRDRIRTRSRTFQLQEKGDSGDAEITVGTTLSITEEGPSEEKDCTSASSPTTDSLLPLGEHNSNCGRARSVKFAYSEDKENASPCCKSTGAQERKQTGSTSVLGSVWEDGDEDSATMDMSSTLGELDVNRFSSPAKPQRKKKASRLCSTTESDNGFRNKSSRMNHNLASAPSYISLKKHETFLQSPSSADSPEYSECSLTSPPTLQGAQTSIPSKTRRRYPSEQRKEKRSDYVDTSARRITHPVKTGIGLERAYREHAPSPPSRFYADEEVHAKVLKVKQEIREDLLKSRVEVLRGQRKAVLRLAEETELGTNLAGRIVKNWSRLGGMMWNVEKEEEKGVDGVRGEKRRLGELEGVVTGVSDGEVTGSGERESKRRRV